MNVNTNISSIGVQLIQSGSGTSQAIPQASSSADLGSDTSEKESSPPVTQSSPPPGMGQVVDKTV